MSKRIIVGTIALAAVIAVAVYLANDSADRTAATIQSASENVTGKSAPPAADAQLDSTSQGDVVSQSAHTATKPVPADPRLAALMVSKDNGLIEFVVGSDGNVIKEIDTDPTSPGFKKPSREYTYSGDNVIGLISYRYLGDHVQITKTAVSYKPDGSVDQYLESTSYDYGAISEKRKAIGYLP